MKAFMTPAALIFSVLGISFFAQAGNGQIGSATLNAGIRAELQKDLHGQSSCFKGGVLKFNEAMRDQYGGRYHDVNLDETETIEANMASNRNLDRYCKPSDIHGNRSADANAAYQACVAEGEQTILVVVKADAADAGEFVTKSVTYAVTLKNRATTILNKGDDLYSETTKPVNLIEQQQMTCKKLDL